MISSRDGEAVAVHRARNTANSALRYAMDPMEQYKLQNAIDEDGLDLGVIYHSHTRSDPVPSETDINLAKLGDTNAPAFPGTLYLIVGVKGQDDDLRLFEGLVEAARSYAERTGASRDSATAGSAR